MSDFPFEGLDALQSATITTWVRWETVKYTRWPRIYDMPIAIMNRELNALEKFEGQAAASGLKKPTTEAPSHA